MIEGVLRHCNEMQVEKNYVDSHGQDEAAFAFCHLLNTLLVQKVLSEQEWLDRMQLEDFRRLSSRFWTS